MFSNDFNLGTHPSTYINRNNAYKLYNTPFDKYRENSNLKQNNYQNIQYDHSTHQNRQLNGYESNLKYSYNQNMYKDKLAFNDREYDEYKNDSNNNNNINNTNRTNNLNKFSNEQSIYESRLNSNRPRNDGLEHEPTLVNNPTQRKFNNNHLLNNNQNKANSSAAYVLNNSQVENRGFSNQKISYLGTERPYYSSTLNQPLETQKNEYLNSYQPRFEGNYKKLDIIENRPRLTNNLNYDVRTKAHSQFNLNDKYLSDSELKNSYDFEVESINSNRRMPPNKPNVWIENHKSNLTESNNYLSDRSEKPTLAQDVRYFNNTNISRNNIPPQNTAINHQSAFRTLNSYQKSNEVPKVNVSNSIFEPVYHHPVGIDNYKNNASRVVYEENLSNNKKYDDNEDILSYYGIRSPKNQRPQVAKNSSQYSNNFNNYYTSDNSLNKYDDYKNANSRLIYGSNLKLLNEKPKYSYFSKYDTPKQPDNNFMVQNTIRNDFKLEEKTRSNQINSIQNENYSDSLSKKLLKKDFDAPNIHYNDPIQSIKNLKNTRNISRSSEIIIDSKSQEEATFSNSNLYFEKEKDEIFSKLNKYLDAESKKSSNLVNNNPSNVYRSLIEIPFTDKYQTTDNHHITNYNNQYQNMNTNNNGNFHVTRVNLNNLKSDTKSTNYPIYGADNRQENPRKEFENKQTFLNNNKESYTNSRDEENPKIISPRKFSLPDEKTSGSNYVEKESPYLNENQLPWKRKDDTNVYQSLNNLNWSQIDNQMAVNNSRPIIEHSNLMHIKQYNQHSLNSLDSSMNENYSDYYSDDDFNLLNASNIQTSYVDPPVESFNQVNRSPSEERLNKINRNMAKLNGYLDEKNGDDIKLKNVDSEIREYQIRNISKEFKRFSYNDLDDDFGNFPRSRPIIERSSQVEATSFSFQENSLPDFSNNYDETNFLYGRKSNQNMDFKKKLDENTNINKKSNGENEKLPQNIEKVDNSEDKMTSRIMNRDLDDEFITALTSGKFNFPNYKNRAITGVYNKKNLSGYEIHKQNTRENQKMIGQIPTITTSNTNISNESIEKSKLSNEKSNNDQTNKLIINIDGSKKTASYDIPKESQEIPKSVPNEVKKKPLQSYIPIPTNRISSVRKNLKTDTEVSVAEDNKENVKTENLNVEKNVLKKDEKVETVAKTVLKNLDLKTENKSAPIANIETPKSNQVKEKNNNETSNSNEMTTNAIYGNIFKREVKRSILRPQIFTFNILNKDASPSTSESPAPKSDKPPEQSINKQPEPKIEDSIASEFKIGKINQTRSTKKMIQNEFINFRSNDLNDRKLNEKKTSSLIHKPKSDTDVITDLDFLLSDEEKRLLNAFSANDKKTVTKTLISAVNQKPTINNKTVQNIERTTKLETIQESESYVNDN